LLGKIGCEVLGWISRQGNEMATINGRQNDKLITFVVLVILISVGAVYMITADMLIACVLVDPVGNSEHDYWFWINNRPWLALVGAFMNVVGLAALLTRLP
jgi:hypothetical protein